MTMRTKRYHNSAVRLLFMCHTYYFEPLEPIEPAPPLPHASKGQHVQGANPEPRTPNPFSFSIAEQFPILYNDILR